MSEQLFAQAPAVVKRVTPMFNSTMPRAGFALHSFRMPLKPAMVFGLGVLGGLFLCAKVRDSKSNSLKFGITGSLTSVTTEMIFFQLDALNMRSKAQKGKNISAFEVAKRTI